MDRKRRSRAERRAAFEAETRLIDEFRRLNSEFAVAPTPALARRIEAVRAALADRGLVFGSPPRHEASSAA